MYTKILLILLLYGYIAGEDDNRNTTKFQRKKEESPRVFNNGTESDYLARRTKQRRQGLVRTYNSKIFKVLAPTSEDEPNGFMAKGDLQPDQYDRSGKHVPMFILSINNFNNNTAAMSHENYNSSEVIQADETYNNFQYYARPPIMENHPIQYSPSYSNRRASSYEYNNPCASYSAPRHFGRRSYSEYDPYQAQGTYNVQFYVPQHQQLNQNLIRFRQPSSHDTWRGVDFNRQFINPCIPNQPIPPPGDRRHIYPYPNPPKPLRGQHYPFQNIISYDAGLPNVQTQVFPPSQIYGNVLPPQQVHRFQSRPPRVIPPRRRTKGFTMLPPYSPSPPTKGSTTPTRYTPPSVWPPPPSKTTSYTPPPIYPPPPCSTKTHTPPTRYTPPRRTKSYTPPPRYTPTTKRNGRSTTPTWPRRTPPNARTTRRTKGY